MQHKVFGTGHAVLSRRRSKRCDGDGDKKMNGLWECLIRNNLSELKNYKWKIKEYNIQVQKKWKCNLHGNNRILNAS